MRQQRWRRITEWPLTIAALIFLIGYGIQVIVNQHGTQRTITDWVMNLTWTLFVVDYIVNLALADHRRAWFHGHLFDLAVVVLPILRPLRLLRLITLLHVLHRTGSMALRGRITVYVVGSVVMLIIVGSLAVLDAEQNAHDAEITNIWQALWWAFVTITTVGYGDLAPVTTQGRLIAVGLMIGGVSLIGVVGATFASWIVQEVVDEDAEHQQTTRAQADRIEAKLDQLLQTGEAGTETESEPSVLPPVERRGGG
ncbi:MAG: ion channel [Pseudoclavibacter sp.]